jgi:hypothetical protein
VITVFTGDNDRYAVVLCFLVHDIVPEIDEKRPISINYGNGPGAEISSLTG